MIEEVKAFRTKDGKVFLIRADAETNAVELQRREANVKWVSAHLGDYASATFTTLDIVNALHDHGHELVM